MSKPIYIFTDLGTKITRTPIPKIRKRNDAMTTTIDESGQTELTPFIVIHAPLL